MLLLYKPEGFRLGHFSRTTKDAAARLPKRAARLPKCAAVLLRPRGRRAPLPVPPLSSSPVAPAQIYDTILLHSDADVLLHSGAHLCGRS